MNIEHSLLPISIFVALPVILWILFILLRWYQGHLGYVKWQKEVARRSAENSGSMSKGSSIPCVLDIDEKRKVSGGGGAGGQKHEQKKFHHQNNYANNGFISDGHHSETVAASFAPAAYSPAAYSSSIGAVGAVGASLDSATIHGRYDADISKSQLMDYRLTRFAAQQVAAVDSSTVYKF